MGTSPADHLLNSPDPDTLVPIVTAWYQTHARDLPWRASGTTPWAILVCEIMSQQTPVTRVAPIWTAWLQRWPDPQTFAQASPAEVLIAWDRLGYPRRALRLLECAQAIMERHGGEVPHATHDLLALPGIGEYTAAAIRAFAFGLHSVVLDTNIRRVLARLHGSALPRPHQTRAEADRAARFVPADDTAASVWNGAIMELGALICTSTSPLCEQCPIATFCQWRCAGYPSDEFSSTRKTQKFTGTQREARGKIMAVLRAHYQNSQHNNEHSNANQRDTSGICRAELEKLSTLPPKRFTPALEALIKDGLAEAHRLHTHQELIALRHQ